MECWDFSSIYFPKYLVSIKYFVKLVLFDNEKNGKWKDNKNYFLEEDSTILDPTVIHNAMESKLPAINPFPAETKERSTK